ncbi:predicted protein, partial [Postia placenta Mad-698-R]
HLNFYRVHILVFTFTPLIFSGIQYGANGKYPVAYIDCLFNCVSAMSVCGLASIDLSRMTAFQQALLFIQMCLGNPVLVSWVMVYIRRSFFAKKFQHIMEANIAREMSEKTQSSVKVRMLPWWRRAIRRFLPRSRDVSRTSSENGERSSYEHRGSSFARVRPEMIRRMDDAPRLVNPSGWISEGRSEPLTIDPTGNNDLVRSAIPVQSPAGPAQGLALDAERSSESEDIDDEDDTSNRSPIMPRTQTVEFAQTPLPLREARSLDRAQRQHLESITQGRSYTGNFSSHSGRRGSMRGPTLSLQQSMNSQHSGRRSSMHVPAMHSGFGGFPMPHQIASRLFSRLFPKLEHKLTRTLTLPRTRTIASQHGSLAPGARAVSYISFEATVGRNSRFRALTRDQQEELGGVEFRALSALLWIVGGYHILTQLLGFMVISSYMSISRWSDDFKIPQLYRDISPVWFSAFQAVSAYTNAGMSLEDESMVPFQRAYPTILAMIFLILAGNTAFVGLQFLLHATDWFFFLVLDLGNSAVTSIPIGVRIIDGLLQAVAVRAAGFSVVTLSDLVPAVKVLYVIMMYVSVYPVAMSVRSTNVYEEKSLGVFEDEDESIDVDETFTPSGNRMTVWSRYLGQHMRKQLSFDMWWLGTALFLICIIEKDKLQDDANATWFNIFRILFETVSAYGGVGLSLGVPYDNYSFCGAFNPLSKLIICAVMLRGRHRGLPVAIDRAVMLPMEY